MGLEQVKRKPFMELMKKLREAKKAPGTKEDKKKATSTLDVDIHKLLGAEYKRYRAVQGAVNALHANSAKKTASASVSALPPPPPLATMLPGSKGKKKTKKPSTTV